MKPSQAIDTYNPVPCAASDAPPASILIVDDLPDKLLTYESILEDLGQNIIKAHTGQEALKLVLQQEFAVILLDVNMPGMDGFETAALIRQRKKSAHTPIIFLTAFLDDMHMAQGYASGAVDYLPTPVVPEVLKAKVKVFIELSQMRQQAAYQAEESAKRTAAEELTERFAFLATASEQLSKSQSRTEIFRKLLELPIPYLGDTCFLWQGEEMSNSTTIEQAWIDNNNGLHFQLFETLPPTLQWLKNAIGHTLDSGECELLEPVSHARYEDSPVIRSLPTPLQPMNFAITMPITIKGKTVGVLVFGRRSSGQKYTFNDMSLSNDFASRASVALENIMLLEKIREADQRKDEFLATLAHELRNPLAPIHNALQFIRHSNNQNLRIQAEETIARQLDHMVHLIDDLMDISRINKGKIELRKERVSLKKVLLHAIETSTPHIEQNSHILKTSIPAEDIWIDGDSARLSQIFSNLLNNAVKYTNPGGCIDIEVTLPDMNFVTVTIADNGIGIPSNMLDTIFEMFTQVDSSLERSQGGLGIGLTLVKSLVELHNGSITAESEGLNKGSKFIMTLPASAAPTSLAVDANMELPKATTSHRVLVVDDNEASAKTLGWMMELSGHEILLAHDGINAIKLAREYQPSIVLLDIGLPGMNGYEVCKTMRSEPLLKNTVFIAQSGWGQREHREKSKEAGFSHYLVKPINLNTLQQLLSGLPSNQS